MSDSTVGQALGLIETRGYAALIAATDAAAKYAHVDIRSVQRASGGLVLVTLVGDVASVQSAVDAGAQEATQVGELVSSHVIPRPEESVWSIVQPDSAPREKAEPARAQVTDTSEDAAQATPDDLDTTPVRELRKLARSLAGTDLTGREISKANRAQLVDVIRKARG